MGKLCWFNNWVRPIQKESLLMKTAISLLLSFVLAVLPLLTKSNKTTADIQLYKSIKYAPQVRVDCPGEIQNYIICH